MNVTSEYAIASQFIARIWSSILPVLHLPEGSQSAVHLPGIFDPLFIEEKAWLPLADSRPPRQTVALVDEDRFERSSEDRAIEVAYDSRPRTRVYEGIDSGSDGWFSLVALQLANLARCRVVCTMYESAAGDLSMGAHVDEWFGAIVQMHGCKDWRISAGGAETVAVEIQTKPGDVLLLPQNIEHEVSTPEHSTHIVFAFVESTPLAAVSNCPAGAFVADSGIRSNEHGTSNDKLPAPGIRRVTTEELEGTG
ncbi:JmjC domain-containing protein [Nocardia nova]